MCLTIKLLCLPLYNVGGKTVAWPEIGFPLIRQLLHHIPSLLWTQPEILQPLSEVKKIKLIHSKKLFLYAHRTHNYNLGVIHA